ncbi:uncharacterized protein K441DRAFT_664598, partial [Cenococcum geophilum 1.58]|uniref:uncharacterized protein n=1 Tax=Cenococcum geophilum 1.58 TaxID=794803 RepID=UPI00358DDC87
MPSLSYSYSFKSYGSKIVRDLSARLWSLQELQLASRAIACPKDIAAAQRSYAI